jgi:DNA-binding response OmpR family regulator
LSVVWILEKARSPGAKAAAALMGDYAVRVFASLASFETVLRFDRQTLPNLLVIDADDAAAPAARIGRFVGAHFLDTPVIVLVGPGATFADPALERCTVVPKPVDGLVFSRLAADAIHGVRGGRRNVVRYKDLVLDVERRECVLMPGEESLSLPLKEAQILRLLFARPGACVSRDEISASLWHGVKVTPRTIDSHVSRLRKRLGETGVSIESVYGGGYVLR